MARKIKNLPDNSVSTVYEDIDNINNFNTYPIAIEVLKKMKNTEFIGAIVIFKWVLPVLAPGGGGGNDTP